MRVRKKKKTSPAAVGGALVVLAFGSLLCARSFGLFDGGTPLAALNGADEDPDAAESAANGSQGDLGDLLLTVGTYREAGDLPMVFAAVPPETPAGGAPLPLPSPSPQTGVVEQASGSGTAPTPGTWPAAAPNAETQPPRTQVRPGSEPPRLAVTFVMVGGSVARACVDGTVVGVGDRVAAGVVTAIVRDGIEVAAATGKLFYDLSDPRPRGHRSGPQIAETREGESK